MKKSLVVLCCWLLLMPVGLVAQKNSTSQKNLIEEANQLYKEGQYSDAAKLYEEELEKGEAAELYYNLGNSYYKSGEIGLAILNYERALRLTPNFDDARYNLKIAQSKVVDNVNMTSTFFVKRIANSLIESFSSNQWGVVSFICFIVMLTLFFVFAFSKTRNGRKYSFFTMLFFGIFFILTFVFSGIRKEQFVNHKEAIVLNGAVTAKSSPDKSGTDIFQLHEGTKVTVKSTLGDWTEISLDNGAVGWVEESTIARI